MFGSSPAKASRLQLSPTRACPRVGCHGLTIKQHNSVYSDTLTVLHLSNVSVYVDTMPRPSGCVPNFFSQSMAGVLVSILEWRGPKDKTPHAFS